MEATPKSKPQSVPRQDDATVDPQTSPPKPSPDDLLQPILERARQGDVSVLPQLKQVLDENESLWRDSHNMVAMSEQAWLDKIAGKDLFASQSLRRQVEKLKLDLLGTSPTPLEKLLVDRIAAAWLGVHHAEMAEAFGDASGNKVAQMRLKRLESANKRFLAATKALVVARRLTNGIKIEINHIGGDSDTRDGERSAPASPTSAKRGDSSPNPHSRTPVSPSATSDGTQTDAVRQRLNTLFKEDAADAEEKELASLGQP